MGLLNRRESIGRPSLMSTAFSTSNAAPWLRRISRDRRPSVVWRHERE